MKSRAKVPWGEFAICEMSGGYPPENAVYHGSVSPDLRAAFLADEPAAETPSARLLAAVDGVISGPTILAMGELQKAREAMRAEPAPVEGPDPYEQRLMRQLLDENHVEDYPPDADAGTWGDNYHIRQGIAVALGMYREAREKGQITAVSGLREKAEPNFPHDDDAHSRIDGVLTRIEKLESGVGALRMVVPPGHDLYVKRLAGQVEKVGGRVDEMVEMVDELVEAVSNLRKDHDAICRQAVNRADLESLYDFISKRIERLEKEGTGALGRLEMVEARIGDLEGELAAMKIRKEQKEASAPERTWTRAEIEAAMAEVRSCYSDEEATLSVRLAIKGVGDCLFGEKEGGK